jgi:hypothetical protein
VYENADLVAAQVSNQEPISYRKRYKRKLECIYEVSLPRTVHIVFHNGKSQMGLEFYKNKFSPLTYISQCCNSYVVKFGITS